MVKPNKFLFGNRNIQSTPLRFFVLGLCGFLLTLFYDVATTLSFALFTAGTDLQKLASTFAFGITFYAVHSLSNTLIFVTVVPGVQMALRRYSKS